MLKTPVRLNNKGTGYVKDINNIPMTGERDVHLDVLRILAAFFVIMVHVAGTGLLKGRDYELGSLNWYICMIFSSLARWSVPVFVMISGSCFLPPTKTITLKKLFGKYILRVFVALVVWSSFYAYFFHGKYIPLGLNSGNHLWYLTMIIGIYLALPILKVIPTVLLKYFTLIWFIFLTIDFINKLTVNAYLIVDIEHYFFMGYIGYFILGYLIYSQNRTKKINLFIYIIGIFSFIFTAISAITLSFTQQETSQQMFSYFSPNVVLMSMSVFAFILNRKFEIKNEFTKLINSIAISTFGIYLVHMFILIEIYTRVVRFVQNPLIFIPLICIVTFIVGYIITLFLKKIPFISKYIV